jgi:hypothetical protein
MAAKLHQIAGSVAQVSDASVLKPLTENAAVLATARLPDADVGASMKCQEPQNESKAQWEVDTWPPDSKIGNKLSAGTARERTSEVTCDVGVTSDSTSSEGLQLKTSLADGDGVSQLHLERTSQEGSSTAAGMPATREDASLVKPLAHAAVTVAASNGSLPVSILGTIGVRSGIAQATMDSERLTGGPIEPGRVAHSSIAHSAKDSDTSFEHMLAHASLALQGTATLEGCRQGEPKDAVTVTACDAQVGAIDNPSLATLLASVSTVVDGLDVSGKGRCGSDGVVKQVENKGEGLVERALGAGDSEPMELNGESRSPDDSCPAALLQGVDGEEGEEAREAPSTRGVKPAFLCLDQNQVMAPAAVSSGDLANVQGPHTELTGTSKQGSKSLGALLAAISSAVENMDMGGRAAEDSMASPQGMLNQLQLLHDSLGASLSHLHARQTSQGVCKSGCSTAANKDFAMPDELLSEPESDAEPELPDLTLLGTLVAQSLAQKTLPQSRHSGLPPKPPLKPRVPPPCPPPPNPILLMSGGAALGPRPPPTFPPVPLTAPPLLQVIPQPRPPPMPPPDIPAPATGPCKSQLPPCAAQNNAESASRGHNAPQASSKLDSARAAGDTAVIKADPKNCFKRTKVVTATREATSTSSGSDVAVGKGHEEAMGQDVSESPRPGRALTRTGEGAEPEEQAKTAKAIDRGSKVQPGTHIVPVGCVALPKAGEKAEKVCPMGSPRTLASASAQKMLKKKQSAGPVADGKHVKAIFREAHPQIRSAVGTKVKANGELPRKSQASVHVGHKLKADMKDKRTSKGLELTGMVSRTAADGLSVHAPAGTEKHQMAVQTSHHNTGSNSSTCGGMLSTSPRKFVTPPAKEHPSGGAGVEAKMRTASHVTREIGACNVARKKSRVGVPLSSKPSRVTVKDAQASAVQPSTDVTSKMPAIRAGRAASKHQQQAVIGELRRDETKASAEQSGKGFGVQPARRNDASLKGGATGKAARRIYRPRAIQSSAELLIPKESKAGKTATSLGQMGEAAVRDALSGRSHAETPGRCMAPRLPEGSTAYRGSSPRVARPETLRKDFASQHALPARNTTEDQAKRGPRPAALRLSARGRKLMGMAAQVESPTTWQRRQAMESESLARKAAAQALHLLQLARRYGWDGEVPSDLLAAAKAPNRQPAWRGLGVNKVCWTGEPPPPASVLGVSTFTCDRVFARKGDKVIGRNGSPATRSEDSGARCQEVALKLELEKRRKVPPHFAAEPSSSPAAARRGVAGKKLLHQKGKAGARDVDQQQSILEMMSCKEGVPAPNPLQLKRKLLESKRLVEPSPKLKRICTDSQASKGLSVSFSMHKPELEQPQAVKGHRATDASPRGALQRDDCAAMPVERMQGQVREHVQDSVYSGRGPVGLQTSPAESPTNERVTWCDDLTESKQPHCTAIRARADSLSPRGNATAESDDEVSITLTRRASACGGGAEVASPTCPQPVTHALRTSIGLHDATSAGTPAVLLSNTAKQCKVVGNKRCRKAAAAAAAAAAPDDARLCHEIKKRLAELLPRANLELVTAATVRMHLERSLKQDLRPQKKFISKQINLFLSGDFAAACPQHTSPAAQSVQPPVATIASRGRLAQPSNCSKLGARNVTELGACPNSTSSGSEEIVPSMPLQDGAAQDQAAGAESSADPGSKGAQPRKIVGAGMHGAMSAGGGKVARSGSLFLPSRRAQVRRSLGHAAHAVPRGGKSSVHEWPAMRTPTLEAAAINKVDAPHYKKGVSLELLSGK